MTKRPKHGFLHDEQGDRSFARLALAWVMVFTGLLIIGVAVFSFKVPDAVWSLLGTAIIGLMAWAGGRAIARYIGPQIGAVAAGIGAKDTAGPANDGAPGGDLRD